VEGQLIEENVSRRAASGVLWLAAQKWAVRASGFVTLIVLTRQVSPQAFGVVAAAMTVIPMVYLLADLGFSTYLLQADDVDQPNLSTAFWASVAAGVILSAALAATAPLLADAFRTPELAAVLQALVLAVVPTVLAGVPLALLRRGMAFRAVAVQGVIAALLAQVVAVAVAILGGGVWALVSQVVVSQWVIAVLAWRRARWIPSLYLSPSKFKDMALFGIRVSGVDLVATSRMVAESWIITVTLGPAAMGLLNIAQRVIQVAQELVAASLVPVSTVFFAKYRGTPDRLRTSYIKALGVAYAVIAPMMILILVTAPLLVPLLFGPEWIASVAPAQVLAVAGVMTLGATLDHGLFYGLGRPGTWLAYAVIVDVGTVATTALAVRWGLVGVAAGFVVVALAATAARWGLVAKLIGLRVRDVARPFLTVIVPSAATAVMGTMLLTAMTDVAWPLAGLGTISIVVVVVNLVLLRLIAGQIILDALGILPLPDRYVRRVGRVLRLRSGSPVADGASHSTAT
jgi:O-antigen/teichoic acid export membrane protein